ncbi:hypothetical protein [Streptacidiphilus jiangxiensis]|nr:hypothetical protein [Streptacidiphilus jiangxiensis]
MNDRAVSLLGAIGHGAAVPGGEPTPALRARLAGGLVVRDGAVVLAETARRSVGPAEAARGDLTGWECGVNSFHLEDYVDVPVGRLDEGGPVVEVSAQRELLLQGLGLAREVCALGRNAVPPIPLRCIVSAGPSNAVFRFHRVRAGERWHHPDLDAYREEHLVVVEWGPLAEP